MDKETAQKLKDITNSPQREKLLKKQGTSKDQAIEDLDKSKKQFVNTGKWVKLWDAIDKNDQTQVSAILKKNAENIQENEMFDQEGNSMLHRAALLGHAEVLMTLLEHISVKPDITNKTQATPLHLACKNNQENVAKFLIGCGVEINSQDEHGQSPLLICCIHSNFNLASLLVESSVAGHTPEPLDPDLKDIRGLTALNCAAIKGDHQMVELLRGKANANLEEGSPKGCTPLLYAARGGYQEMVRYLLQRGASPLRQDNAGGTVLHHAIEKGHLDVLRVLIEEGIDVQAAIEVADNAGRTPLYEAIDNNASASLVSFLIRKRQAGGFGARVNVTDYNGHSPLYCAVRETNFELVQVLIEEGEAQVDLYGTETKFQETHEAESYDSPEEKYFMEAFYNAMTPLQLSIVFGNDEMMNKLIEKGANPNLQPNQKGYAALHIAVLANKPEIVMELLQKTQANPHLPDFTGRALAEMVEQFLPDYAQHFTDLLDGLKAERQKKDGESNEPLVATHYYNPDDERAIQGAEKEIYKQQQEGESPQKEGEENTTGVDALAQGQRLTHKEFQEMSEEEIKTEEYRETDQQVEEVFGKKIARGLISQQWQIKEMALKIIFKTIEKQLQKEPDMISEDDIVQYTKASIAAVDQTSRDKVIKVFNLSLQIFSLLVASNLVEQKALNTLKNSVIHERNIVHKMLTKSEEGNTRIATKIHEILLDFSFHPGIGEVHVASFIIGRLNQHNRALSQNQKEKDQTLGSPKGFLAQLALLYKFINQFGVQITKNTPLNVENIIKSVTTALQHQNKDIRQAALKILLDTHRLSGCIDEQNLPQDMPEKTKSLLLVKLKDIEVEKNLKEQFQRQQENAKLEQEEDGDQDGEQEKGQGKEVEEVQEKLQSKDWTEREEALKQMKQALESQQNLADDFLDNCTVLLKTCLEERNLNIYLAGVEVCHLLFRKALNSEIVQGSLETLLQAVVVKTSDTNTRARKKSVDLIDFVWTQAATLNENQKKEQLSKAISKVLIDPQLNEKAIIGRLGMFIKKLGKEETIQALAKQPHQNILGLNYEQLTEFACMWCSHKNPKVRQNALKMIIEVCKVNSLDPRGESFKPRIINFILGLRASLRGPLIQKINEVCRLEQDAQEEGGTVKTFIDINEFELNLATNKRSASQDIRKNFRASNTVGALPDIGGGAMPAIRNQNQISSIPVIVLPHSEPLSEEQKTNYQQFIDLFNLEIMTCFLSQTWSTRQASLEKIMEQLHHLDPDRRDAMSAEINRMNFPVEQSFPVFIDFIKEGIKDPVLKIFLLILELMQKSLPTFFRCLQQFDIRKQILPLMSLIIKKTGDLKAKVREASINFCLYLSHQSPIGPEESANQVLQELEQMWKQGQEQSAATSLGNSHLLASCLKMLSQLQIQARLIKKGQQEHQVLVTRYLEQVNQGLKHQNPAVRKEAEGLFIVLYEELGKEVDKKLTGQKSQVAQKLIQRAKDETKKDNQKEEEEKEEKKEEQKIGKDDLLLDPKVQRIFQTKEERALIESLRLPNPQKRLKAIAEIKKVVQKQVIGASEKQTKELQDPLATIVKKVLKDDSPEVYMEALNLLKFVVGALAPYLSVLDLNLMMGSFIGIIVGNTVTGNIRTQIASDKVILFFAKHNNIGPFLVAKDILKQIEKIIKASSVQKDNSFIQEKKAVVIRFFNILMLILQHFSLVLCYQPEFYDKCLDCIADTLLCSSEDAALKNIALQMIVALQQIDQRLLDASVAKMEMKRKTAVRKITIEMENQKRDGKNVITQDHHAFVAPQTTGQNPGQNPQMRDTRQSWLASSKTSLFSPGSTFNDWNCKPPELGANINQQKPTAKEVQFGRRSNRRMGSIEPESMEKQNMLKTQTTSGIGGRGFGAGYNPTQTIEPNMTPRSSMQQIQVGGQDQQKFTLPEIGSTTNKRERTLGGTGLSYQPSQPLKSTGGANYSSKNDENYEFNRKTGAKRTTLHQQDKPPVYVPSRREAPAAKKQTEEFKDVSFSAGVKPELKSSTGFQQFGQPGDQGRGNQGFGAHKKTITHVQQLQSNPVDSALPPRRTSLNRLGSNQLPGAAEVKFEVKNKQYQ